MPYLSFNNFFRCFLAGGYAISTPAATAATHEHLIREKMGIPQECVACHGTGRIISHNRIIVAIGKHVIAQDPLTSRNEGIRIEESTNLRIVISGLQIIEPGLGWVLLCTRRGCPLRNCVFGLLLAEKRECRCYVPASIADVIPRHLSGIFLKPLRAWDYPNNLSFVPNRRCLLVFGMNYFYLHLSCFFIS